MQILLSQGKALGFYLSTVSSIGVVLLDADLKMKDCNQGFLTMFDLKMAPVGSPIGDFLNVGTEGLGIAGAFRLSCNSRTGVDCMVICNTITTDLGLLLFCERLILTKSAEMEQVRSINKELVGLHRKLVKKNLLLEKLRKELAERVSELETTVAQVKELEGILPICMYCKRIRNGDGDWHRLEEYISDHSEAKFSHSICPQCYKEQIKKERKMGFIR